MHTIDDELKSKIEDVKSDLTFLLRYKDIMLQEHWYSEREFWDAVDDALDELSELLNKLNKQ